MTQAKDNIRVLFLFAHLHKGGMQRAVSNISLALPDNFEQYVGFFGTENPGFIYKATMHNFCFPGSESIGFLGKLSSAWNRIKAIRTFVTQENIDVVVSFGESANVYSVLSRHSARTIISSRVALKESLAVITDYSWLYTLLVPALYRRADNVVAVSEDLGRQMRKIIGVPQRVSVIPNLYHLEDIRERSKHSLPENMAFLEEKNFILNVGSLCYQKGQDDLLTIFSQVHRNFDDLYLVILGRGELEEDLKQQTITLGISDRVIFVGFDKNPYRFMSRASVFVFTSRFEGFPNALVEAMACGAPVVSFDCPTGPSEILGNSEFGVLIADRSTSQASEAICELIEKQSSNMQVSQSGLRRADYYSEEQVIKKWVAVLG